MTFSRVSVSISFDRMNKNPTDIETNWSIVSVKVTLKGQLYEIDTCMRVLYLHFKKECSSLAWKIEIVN